MEGKTRGFFTMATGKDEFYVLAHSPLASASPSLLSSTASLLLTSHPLTFAPLAPHSLSPPRLSALTQ